MGISFDWEIQKRMNTEGAFRARERARVRARFLITHRHPGYFLYLFAPANKYKKYPGSQLTAAFLANSLRYSESSHGGSRIFSA